jgi:hypothetical protein
MSQFVKPSEDDEEKMGIRELTLRKEQEIQRDLQGTENEEREYLWKKGLSAALASFLNL